jgi:hypothetical protein
MSTPTVEKVPLPDGTLIRQALARLDYADAYRIRLPAGAARDLDRVVRSAFGSAPRWVELLMRLRNWIVRPLGLKTGPAGSRGALDRVALRAGQRVGLFRVFARADDELLLGEDDRHLDFRVSVLLRSDGRSDWAIVSTVVRFNNWLGRAYFLPVRPLHGLIVPALLRHALIRYSNDRP